MKPLTVSFYRDSLTAEATQMLTLMRPEADPTGSTLIVRRTAWNGGMETPHVPLVSEITRAARVRKFGGLAGQITPEMTEEQKETAIRRVVECYGEADTALYRWTLPTGGLGSVEPDDREAGTRWLNEQASAFWQFCREGDFRPRRDAGRPALADPLTKRKNRIIVMSDDEWERLRHSAAEDKMSISEFVRHRCL